MKKIQTHFEGVFVIDPESIADNRGLFAKVFNHDWFKDNGLCTKFDESYYSISNKNVIRGMHFQLPPYDHEKLVYVPQGSIIDISLDLRKGSTTYGQFFEVEISSTNRKTIYIPKGFAHGFKALEDNTITTYHVATTYSQNHDTGINLFSFGYNWKTDNPIMSKRDSSFIDFSKFDSPFYLE